MGLWTSMPKRCSSPVALNRRPAHTMIEYFGISNTIRWNKRCHVNISSSETLKFETCFRSSFPDATRKHNAGENFRNTAGGKVSTSTVYNLTFHRMENWMSCIRLVRICLLHNTHFHRFFAAFVDCNLCIFGIWQLADGGGDGVGKRNRRREDWVRRKHLDASIEHEPWLWASENELRKMVETGKCDVK